MSFKEKSTWIMAVLTVGAYLVYLSVILGRAENTQLTEVPYIATLLWTIGAVIVASIVAHIAVAIASPKDVDKEDQRDREIERLGEYRGNWFVVIGAVAALGMAMAELSHFWIANVIYLAFVLATLLGSVTKIVAYRRGFQQW
ncbi:MAG: hypothetical protein ACR2QT_09395 [Woeseiaceae bacterium]